MIDALNWKYLYKRSPDTGFHNNYCETNLMYTPWVKPQKGMLCMHWSSDSEYQKASERPLLTQELLDYFFNKEIEYITRFQNFDYTPKLYDVDYNNRKVYIEFPGETCNDIVYDSRRSLDEECPGWQQQLQYIVESIYNQGVYKVSLYPHCFFISNGRLKTFDWYGCLDKDDCMIDYQFLRGMMGNKSSDRFVEARVGKDIDFSVFFEKGLDKHIIWPGNPLVELHNKLYGTEE